jgi:hypothetical protein
MNAPPSTEGRELQLFGFHVRSRDRSARPLMKVKKSQDGGCSGTWGFSHLEGLESSGDAQDGSRSVGR